MGSAFCINRTELETVLNPPLIFSVDSIHPGLIDAHPEHTFRPE
jgi:hypothetical protein